MIQGMLLKNIFYRHSTFALLYGSGICAMLVSGKESAGRSVRARSGMKVKRRSAFPAAGGCRNSPGKAVGAL